MKRVSLAILSIVSVLAVSCVRAGAVPNDMSLLLYNNSTTQVHVDTIGFGAGGANWRMNMEMPYGSTLISNYAMVKQRHMHEYGTTTEQLAGISMATRHHAMNNPEAVQAMTDLQFVGVNDITEQDVLDSRVIAEKFVAVYRKVIMGRSSR